MTQLFFFASTKFSQNIKGRSQLWSHNFLLHWTKYILLTSNVSQCHSSSRNKWLPLNKGFHWPIFFGLYYFLKQFSPPPTKAGSCKAVFRYFWISSKTILSNFCFLGPIFPWQKFSSPYSPSPITPWSRGISLQHSFCVRRLLF